MDRNEKAAVVKELSDKFAKAKIAVITDYKGLTVSKFEGVSVPAGGSASVSLPTGAGVEMSADGSFVYTPDADWNGTDSFEYEVSDGNGGTATGVVTVTVNPVLDLTGYWVGSTLAQRNAPNVPLRVTIE